MTEPRPILPLVTEEIEYLKWFEAFMHRRVELEQQMISGLQALLDGSSSLPESKPMWQCAFEKLLDGTRDELQIRIEELETLNVQMQAVGMSITKAEMCIRKLNSEFEELEPTDSVGSAQAATATLYKGWHDIKSVEAKKTILPGLLSSGRAQNEKRENEKRLKERKAFEKYHKQDLAYRRIVHQQQQTRGQFLNSLPHRVQEYGTEYWTAVRDVGMVMESFATYIRDISSTCNSFGSALWASAKDIKPLVDANCHTEAIELAYRQSRSPIRFSPIYYQNPGSRSPYPGGQTILFGCPLELCTFGVLKRIPPLLEYLLDSVPYGSWKRTPEMSPEMYPGEDCWRLVNELEQAWTGVEEPNRAFIFDIVTQSNLGSFIIAYLMSLPKPILSYDDIVEVQNSSNVCSWLIWDTWSKDPIKEVVLHAILSCLFRSEDSSFIWDMAAALGQNTETSMIVALLHILLQNPDAWMFTAIIV